MTSEQTTTTKHACDQGVVHLTQSTWEPPDLGANYKDTPLGIEKVVGAVCGLMDRGDGGPINDDNLMDVLTLISACDK